jgi:hypothetical protein
VHFNGTRFNPNLGVHLPNMAPGGSMSGDEEDNTESMELTDGMAGTTGSQLSAAADAASRAIAATYATACPAAACVRAACATACADSPLGADSATNESAATHTLGSSGIFRHGGSAITGTNRARIGAASRHQCGAAAASREGDIRD